MQIKYDKKKNQTNYSLNKLKSTKKNIFWYFFTSIIHKNYFLSSLQGLFLCVLNYITEKQLISRHEMYYIKHDFPLNTLCDRIDLNLINFRGNFFCLFKAKKKKKKNARISGIYKQHFHFLTANVFYHIKG